jgi:hypothetical protein
MRQLVLGLAGVGAALSVAACEKVPGTKAYAAAQQAEADQKLMTEAQTIAARDLRDPSAAQFRAVFVQRKPVGAAPWAGAPVVCGEVNGKNAYGAYAGFVRFIASPSKGVGQLEPPPAVEGDAQSFNDALLFRISWVFGCLGGKGKV